MEEKKSTNKACYFLSLKVENVACFGKPQTLDLSNKKGEPARWTVIIGDNAVGKTTLLRCLAGISPYNTIEDEEAVYTFGKQLKNLRRKEGLPIIEAHFAVDYRFSTDKKAHKVLKRRLIGGKATGIEIDAGFDDVYFVCHGYGAARRMGRSEFSKDKESSSTKSLFDEDVSLINAEGWLLQSDYIAAKEKKYSKYKKQVEEIIINLLPDVKGLNYSIGKQFSEVQFETPSGWVGIYALGLGYRTMLAWIVDFAAGLFDRYPESKNPLEEPAVLLLDEIDLHLHPRWQRIIIDYLTEKFPNTQFIVTAHSPLLVQSAAGANLVLLKRKEDNVIIDNDPVSVKNWRIDQILTSDLFGLESPRSKETQKLLDERTRLLSKRRLSPKDEEKLGELEDMLGPMPFGETKEEIEADFLIKEIARKINQKGK
jgi:ABC-type cobalamin/Fe3+-siderophores transport system ATPase subunit